MDFVFVALVCVELMVPVGFPESTWTSAPLEGVTGPG